METLEQTKQNVADLHWLAALVTGCREKATEVTFQAIPPDTGANAFFSSWMHAWSRRIVIAKALAAVSQDLARSSRQIAVSRVEKSERSPDSWTLDRHTTKSDLERALLPIDVFPRAAVLLLIFERVPLNDAAVLLDSDPDLVRKALAAGVRELTINLARMQGWTPTASSTDCEDYHVRATKIPS